MELTEIREHLDRLDNALFMILAERMAFIPKVAAYKSQNNVDRYQPQREKEIIENKRKLAQELSLNPDLVEDIVKRIIEDAHRIEREIMGK
ncbi:MAG: chorismate mutase [Candidatus Woesearchaeota archaeon]